MQNRLPFFLSICGLALLAFFAWLRLPELSGLPLVVSTALVTLYVLWLVLESRVAAGERDQDETPHDRGTLELYALARLATAVTALGLADPANRPAPFLLGGLALFAGGVGMRLWAIRTLGRFYSHRVRTTEGHRIVDTGPYRALRHPAYTGMLLGHVGFVMCFFSWPSAALLCGLFVPAVVLRILVEEQLLARIDGYGDYSRDRKRLVPHLW
jgi:protein-S-isoprenylcysteine O-methyltransferase Ste14